MKVTRPLKLVCIIGLVLALIVSWSMVLFGVIWRGDAAETTSHGSQGRMPENSFARELREYDLFDASRQALAGEDPQQIEKRLSRLEKRARGVEEQLSVLKRRRALALQEKRYISGYEKAAREAAQVFPHSAPLAMVAVEALVTAAATISAEAAAPGGRGDTRALLKTYAERISGSSSLPGSNASLNHFGLLELSIHILAGDMEDPARAAAVPELVNLLSQDSTAIPAKTRQDLLVNEFLLRVIKGDIPGATTRLNTLLATTDSGLWRMGAEFFYDHHNPLRAAELFNRLAGESDIVRAADALALAGEIPGARNIWFALSSASHSSADTSRIFYNLAVSSTDKKEEASWFEKLFSTAQRGRASMDSTRIYAIIRYTRLLDTPRSIAVLSEATASPQAATSGRDNIKQHPLLDLELFRRSLATWPPNRAAAEAWLLLGRNPGEETLYEWVAWYFDHQKLYAETSRLLKEASHKGMSGPWFDLHRSLALIREGKTTEGEKILKEAGKESQGSTGSQGPAGSQDWRIFANLGRIQESRRAVSAAIEYYETAAALVSHQRSAEKTAAAQIQIRLSRCLEALDRRQESRRALEYALELDPDNLNVRHELTRDLRRFDSR